MSVNFEKGSCEQFVLLLIGSELILGTVVVLLFMLLMSVVAYYRKRLKKYERQ